MNKEQKIQKFNDFFVEFFNVRPLLSVEQIAEIVGVTVQQLKTGYIPPEKWYDLCMCIGLYGWRFPDNGKVYHLLTDEGVFLISYHDDDHIEIIKKENFQDYCIGMILEPGEWPL